MKYSMKDLDLAILWGLRWEVNVYETLMASRGRISALKIASENAFLSGAQGANTDVLRAALNDLNNGKLQPTDTYALGWYPTKELLAYSLR